MGLYQFKKHLHRKGNKKVKKQFIEWERIFASHSLEERIKNSNKLEINDLVKKWAVEKDKTLFKRRSTNHQ